MNPAGASDIIIHEIEIRATAEQIFEALTDPAQRMLWWGTEGRFQTTHMESDLRPGGKWLMSGIGMDARPFTIRGEYRQVDPPRAIEFTWLPSWQDDGTASVVRFDLTEKDGMTTVRLTHSGLTTEAVRNSHKGWPQILDWLRSYVAP